VQAVVVTPSQRPAHMACVPVHPVRVPRGAPAMGTHVPTLLGSLHASHWPPQALPQHTPSTQNVLVHSAPVWQVSPAAFAERQTPVASQYLPAPQAPAVQPPMHFVASAHMFDAQGDDVAVVQAPAPLHVVVVLTMPFAQLPAAQTTALPGNLHARPSAPSHVALHGAVPPQAARPPRGAPETIRHFPALLGSLQAEH
jgi:hypothetical protein